MTTGIAAEKSSGPPAPATPFSGSQWGGPETWDGPVWSDKYQKYITQKDQEFDDAAEAVAKLHGEGHNDGGCPLTNFANLAG